MNKKIHKILRKKLAEQVHAQWSGWMEHMFKQGTFNDDGSWTMSVWAVSRWTHQKNTPYAELMLDEKLSDIQEADLFIAIMEKYILGRLL